MGAKAEQIFHEARQMAAGERAGFLSGACGGDAVLRAKVESLLEADAEAGSFLRPDATDCSTLVSDPRESPGDAIGRYKLLQVIGEGGFGTVWMAEQRQPVKRRVALKIIKLGMDTKQVIARFEAERQALAMMDHPNIAKVLDAGATDTGRPYFVMEYIKGIPILEYCDTEKLDTEARLGLFICVCQAIQHAHQKGIIHRDIKPSNVLITLHDGVPIPKVIDFGIAKATNQVLTEKTLFTQHRQMIGTPAYMSPEQAEMSGLDIDTRSDIYSLGVLLYELLTGTTPFANEELLSKGFAEMMRIIREVEPHKPSTRLSTLGDIATRTAQQRHLGDPKKLGLILRGDLDWIVMKCLEKDRTRRYETANGLAADIRRHLADEPVAAGPPSRVYRLKKLARRNKGVFVATAMVFGAIATGLGFACAGLIRAQIANERLGRSIIAEQLERTRAEDAERTARTRAAQLQTAVSDAESARAEAVRARNETERIAYPASLGAASAAILDNDPVSARRFLDEAPESDRGMEWTLLSSLADRSIDTIGDPSIEGCYSAFSPDGTLMAQQEVKGETIRIIDTRTWETVHTLDGLQRWNMGMLFSPDNRWLAVAYSGTNRADIFDLASGDRVVPGGIGWASRAADLFLGFSPDSTRCIVRGTVAGDNNSRIRIWQLDPWKELGPLASQWSGHIPSRIAYSPDGEWIVMGSEQSQPLRILDSDSFELEHEIDLPGSPMTWEIVFNEDGALCATRDSLVSDGRIRCYRSDTWELLWEADHPSLGAIELTGTLRFIPRSDQLGQYGTAAEGWWLAAAGGDGAVYLLDTSDGTLRSVLRGEGSMGMAVGAHTESGRVFSAHRNGIVKVWDVNRATRIRVTQAMKNGSLAFLSAGRGLVAPHSAHLGNGSKVALRFDPLTGRLIGSERLAPIASSHGAHMTSVAESPDGARLALVDGNGWGSGRLRIIDLNTGLAISTWRGTGWGDATDVAWSPDGRYIAVTGEHGGPRVYDGTEYQPVARLNWDESPRPYVTRCAFSADSALLVACDHNGSVNAWDTGSFEPAWTYRPDDQIELEALVFGRDDESVLVGAADGSIIVLSAADGSEERRFDLDGDRITDLVFAPRPDGDRLLTASLDGTVRFLDTADWRELLTLPMGTAVASLAVSEDGQTIAVGASGTLQVLELRPETVLAAERRENARAYEVAKALVEQLSEPDDAPGAIRERLMASDELTTVRVRRQVEIVLGEIIHHEFEEAYDLASLQEIADPECALYVLNAYADTMPTWSAINLGWLADRLSAEPGLSPPRQQAVVEYVRAFRGFVFGNSLQNWYNDLPWRIIRQPGRPTRHYQVAEKALRQLVEWQPESWRAHVNLALALVRTGQYGEAVGVAERSLKMLSHLEVSLLEPKASLVLAHLGLDDIEAAEVHFAELERAIAGGADEAERYLYRQAEAALRSSNWAHDESADRLRQLQARATAENAGPLDLARYATELHITPYEPLRDLDLALAWAERAVELSNRTDDPSILYRLCDLLEVHQAREDAQAAERVRTEILRVEGQQVIAAGDDAAQLSVLLRRHLSTHLERGNEECAEQLFRMFLERFRSVPVVLNNAACDILNTPANPPIDCRYANELAESACAAEEAGNGENLWMYLDTLALARHSSGELEKAVETQRRAVSLIPAQANPRTVYQMRYNLAWFCNSLGLAYTRGSRGLELGNEERQRRAQPLFEQALELQTALQGPRARQTLGEVTNLAMVYNRLGQYDKARELLEENLPIKREVLGPQDQFTHVAMNNLAMAYDGLGRREDAVELAREHLQLHLDPAMMPYATASTLHGAASHLLTSEEVFDELRDPELALELAQRSVVLAERNGDAGLWFYLDTLALALHESSRTEEAIEVQRRAITLAPDTDEEEYVPRTCACPHGRTHLEERLREFEAALAADHAEASGSNRVRGAS